jgi:ABC-2 type transport system permease protein
MGAAAGAARAIWLLARREARSRATGAPLLIGTAALAILLAGYLILQGLVIDRSQTIRVGLAGQAIGLESGLQAGAAQLGLSVDISQVATVTEGTDAVRHGRLDVLVSGATDALQVTVARELDPRLRTALDGLVRAQTLDAQLAEAGLKPSDVDSALAQAGVRQVVQLLPSDPGRGQRLVVGLAMAVLLASVLGSCGTLAARGVAEEKSSGIAEGLLAVTPPGRLLAGRIIGLGVLGLVQLLVLGLLGIAVAAAVGLPVGGSGAALGYGLLWFALGFCLYGTGFAVAGALVARRDQLPRAIAPVASALSVAVLAGFALLGLAGAQEGEGAVAAFSVLPPFAPVLLPGRLALGSVPGWQVALAVVLMLAAIAGLARFAGRVYPSALLREGDPVRLRELLHHQENELSGSRSA